MSFLEWAGVASVFASILGAWLGWAAKVNGRATREVMKGEGEMTRELIKEQEGMARELIKEESRQTREFIGTLMDKWNEKWLEIIQGIKERG